MRIVLDDKKLKQALEKKGHFYISGVSYNGSFGSKDILIKQKKTPVISLIDTDKDKILGSLHDTTRNEVKRTFKMPELSFRLPDDNRSEIYKLYKKFEKKGGRIVRRKSYFKNSIFAGAYWKDKLIAGIICYDIFPYLRVNAIVSERLQESEIKKAVSFATRRLIFELCSHGMQKGYLLIDLGGVNLEEKEKSGITAFKMSFGGELINEYTYTYKSPVFKIFSFLR
ncbi:hypothetical protein ACFL3E_01520 [Patescibacteria group bacterium]